MSLFFITNPGESGQREDRGYGGLAALAKCGTAGLVAPSEFIPLLEEQGLILPVEQPVSGAVACKQGRTWQVAGLPGIHIAVNLSALQFRQPNFTNVVLGILNENGLDPALRTIELELTESLLME